jgi:hypothetical protein
VGNIKYEDRSVFNGVFKGGISVKVHWKYNAWEVFDILIKSVDNFSQILFAVAEQMSEIVDG